MQRRMLITGGAGFIGCHVVRHFAEKGYEIVVLDDLSRRGSAANLDHLKEHYPLTHHQVDVRQTERVEALFRNERRFEVIVHLAAQVAVTTSVVNPREDFEVNALGTFNLLECFRKYCPEALFLFASTNKVYGGLTDLEVIEANNRYRFAGLDGISEDRLLDFHSPYGCSKGAADQYVIDYARIYDLHTVSFRQSCIYGQRQFGVEDQGWVAWFVIAGVLGVPITVYGDGKQVRDVLYVEDLVQLYDLAIAHKEKMHGKAYNVGGGPGNTLSLLELLAHLGSEGLQINYGQEDWRPGDQKIFVSDNTKVSNELNWVPKVAPDEGVGKLIDWVRAHQALLKQVLGK